MAAESVSSSAEDATRPNAADAGAGRKGQGQMHKPTESLRMPLLIVMVLVFALNARGETRMEKAGDIAQVAIPATACLSTLVVRDSEGTAQFCKSLVGVLGITYTLKYVVDKDRPEGHGENAFPSGHTAAAFQGATFIQRRYGWLYGVPSYLGAAFVGWTRVEAESDKHDAVDVLGGAAIGVLVSYWFTTSYGGVALVPVVGNGKCGFYISSRW